MIKLHPFLECNILEFIIRKLIRYQLLLQSLFLNVRRTYLLLKSVFNFTIIEMGY